MPPISFDSWTWRCGTALANLMARLGVGPMARLTTTGRITSRAHTVPVVPIDHAGSRWLVAPYGPVAWVHNARADPTVTLRHGRSTARYTAREVGPDDAGPVLQRYVQVAARARSSFTAGVDAPAAAFTAEADRHPVFELRAAA
jgi:deazaflavin-dependent oxidoreductase (nitroreductase family)